MPQAPQSTARSRGAAVHSLDHFAFTVPDLDEAARFYTEFGLDVRRVDGRIDLHTFGHPHRWGLIRVQTTIFGDGWQGTDADSHQPTV